MLQALFDQLPSHLKSTDPPAPNRDLGPMPTERDGHLGSRMGYAASQPARPRGYDAHQEQWSLQPATAAGISLYRNRTASPLHEPAAQPVPMPGLIASRGHWDVIDFPMEDPFAYPTLPGVNLANNNLTTIDEDTMRLPLYNLLTNVEGQLMHFRDAPQATPYISTPTQSGESRPIHPGVSSGLNDLGSGLFWEPPGPFGGSPF
jgi:hypothetical protein